MSRSLTADVVYEELQQVLHDLHDLSMFGDRKMFRGIVIEDLQFVWRDEPLSHWKITIEPVRAQQPRKLMEILADMEDDGDKVDQPTNVEVEAAQGGTTQATTADA